MHGEKKAVSITIIPTGEGLPQALAAVRDCAFEQFYV
jgi:hypothetical protein